MKRTVYHQRLKVLPSSKIYLNVDFIKKGRYELKIIHNQQIIKTIYFDKS